MDEPVVFRVLQKDGVTVIENHSENTLCLYLKPKKPKRAYRKVLLIQANCFRIFDKHMPLDLTEMMFSLEK